MKLKELDLESLEGIAGGCRELTDGEKAILDDTIASYKENGYEKNDTLERMRAAAKSESDVVIIDYFEANW